MKKIIEIVTSKFFLIGLIAIAVALLAVFNIRHNSSLDQRDASEIEYRTDTQPIIDRFPSLPAFKSCHWKANTIGRTDFGPTNYCMNGFIVQENESYLELIRYYMWKPVTVKFPKGIEPEITSIKEFNWSYNEEFEMLFKSQSFIGNVYFDTLNGVLYFSVENL